MTIDYRFVQNRQLLSFRLLWTAKMDKMVDDDRLETISIQSSIVIIVNLALVSVAEDLKRQLINLGD